MAKNMSDAQFKQLIDVSERMREEEETVRYLTHKYLTHQMMLSEEVQSKFGAHFMRELRKAQNRLFDARRQFSFIIEDLELGL